jgi:hypothetical protein
MAMFQIIGLVGMWTQGAQEKEWEMYLQPGVAQKAVGQQSRNANELEHLALPPLRNIEI